MLSTWSSTSSHRDFSHRNYFSQLFSSGCHSKVSSVILLISRCSLVLSCRNVWLCTEQKKKSTTITIKPHSTWLCSVLYKYKWCIFTTPGSKFTRYLDSIWTSEKLFVPVGNTCDYRYFADIIFLIYQKKKKKKNSMAFITIITTLIFKLCILLHVTVQILVTVTINATWKHILHLICHGEGDSESSAAFLANRWLHRCCLCQRASLSPESWNSEVQAQLTAKYPWWYLTEEMIVTFYCLFSNTSLQSCFHLSV